LHGHAEVAGGGFAGLTVAIALVQRGWTVQVHERTAGAQEDGAGIFLWENGLRALRALGLELTELVDTHEAGHWEERDETGRLIGRRELPLPGGIRMVTLARRDLHRALLDVARKVGVSVLTNSAAIGADAVDRYEAARVRSWSSGRAAIVGDAAHAMPPTIGQGAGTAMINAVSLAAALSRCERAEDALEEWEAAERPETEVTQRASIERLGTLFPRPGERRDSWEARPLRAAGRAV